MTSIVISSNDHELCSKIGKKTAETIGLEHVDRALLERVATRYGVSEDRLRRVLDPDASRRFSVRSRGVLLGYIATATLEEFQKDGIVCTGLAAHLFVKGVSHVLMVNVLDDPRELTARIVATKNVSVRKAEKILQRARDRRARWSLDNFGIDELDPSNYDVVLSVRQIDQVKLVEMIADLAGYRKFRAMTYSRNRVRELLLASKVRVALLTDYPDVKVTVNGTRAIVHVTCSKRAKGATIVRIKEAVAEIDGIDSAEVHTASSLPMVERMRKALPIG